MTNNANQSASGSSVPNPAGTFFSGNGRQESHPKGSYLFTESRHLGAVAPADARIYVLTSGMVTLTRNGKPISLIMPGEIFGATSLILPSSRFSTAQALKDSTVISLDFKQFLNELQRNPEFILSLLRDLSKRLQNTMGRAIKLDLHAVQPPVSAGLSANEVTRMAEILRGPVAARCEAGGKVISEGAHAIYMYVLREGQVNIMVNDRVVEIIKPGIVFGEIALVSETRRAASAVAEQASAWYSLGTKELVAVTKADAALGLALLRSLAKRMHHAGYLLSENPSGFAVLHIRRLNAEAHGGDSGVQSRNQHANPSAYTISAGAFIELSNGLMTNLAKAIAGADKTGAQKLVNTIMLGGEKIGTERLCFQLDTLSTALSVGHASIIDEVMLAVRAEHIETCDEIRDFIDSRTNS
jgi:CRP-like cAMP-binding protein